MRPLIPQLDNLAVDLTVRIKCGFPHSKSVIGRMKTLIRLMESIINDSDADYEIAMSPDTAIKEMEE
jgi:hypothetical protein